MNWHVGSIQGTWKVICLECIYEVNKNTKSNTTRRCRWFWWRKYFILGEEFSLRLHLVPPCWFCGRRADQALFVLVDCRRVFLRSCGEENPDCYCALWFSRFSSIHSGPSFTAAEKKWGVWHAFPHFLRFITKTPQKKVKSLKLLFLPFPDLWTVKIRRHRIPIFFILLMFLSSLTCTNSILSLFFILINDK
jgi:hypothetical protein